MMIYNVFYFHLSQVIDSQTRIGYFLLSKKNYNSFFLLTSFLDTLE